MISKICASLILLCLFIAIPLSLMGLKQVELGVPFLAFMKQCNNELSEFKIGIPDIPTIPKFNNADGFLVILNAFISFVNMLVTIINTFTEIINVVIQFIQFVVIVLKNLITLKDNLVNYSIPVL